MDKYGSNLKCTHFPEWKPEAPLRADGATLVSEPDVPGDAADTLYSLGPPPQGGRHSIMRHTQAQRPMLLSHRLSELSPLSGGDTEQHLSGGWNVLSADV